MGVRRVFLLLAALALLWAGAEALGQGRETVADGEGVVRLVLEELAAGLVIEPSPDSSIHAEAQGPAGAAGRVRLERAGERVRVLGSAAVAAGRPGSGSVVRPGHAGRITIREGESGREATAAAPPDGSTVRLLVPPGLALEGRVASDVKSTVRFAAVRIEVHGRCALDFAGTAAREVQVRAGGSSRLRLSGLDNATVELSLDGGAKVFLEGSFASVKVRAVAGTRFETKGLVHGDYALDLSGAATGRHSGRITGKRTEDLKGVSSFSTFGGL